jgi:TonB family protein
MLFGCNRVIILLSAALLFPAGQAPPREIPAATIQGTADQMTWWEALRAAGREGVEAWARKDEAIARAKRAQVALSGSIRSSREEDLIPKRELEKMNAEITAATEKLTGVLRDGREKGLHPPLPDGPPTILHKSIAGYTDEARRSKVKGTVVISLLMNSDGTISDATVVRGLGAGLDENALAAARKIFFLPTIKQSAFVPLRTTLEFTFNIY